MKWSEEMPSKEGKYVVQTKSGVLKTIRTLDANLNFDSKGNPSWSFSNQTFYRVLAPKECVHPFKKLHWVGNTIYCNKCGVTLIK